MRIKQRKLVLLVLAVSLPNLFSTGCRKEDGYRTGGKVSDAYVNPDAIQEVKEEDIRAMGFEYDYENLTYDLVWSDEFDYEGLPDDTKWGYDVGGHGWGNNELQYYTEGENAFVKDGHLVIEARKEQKEGMEYTSARLVTREKGDWLYGKIEVSAKLPAGLGTWPAIWMLSTDWEYGGWPASGEIDIMEHVGYDQNTIHASIHTQSYYHSINTQKTANKYVEGVCDGFHVYTVEWLPDKILAFLECVIAAKQEISVRIADFNYLFPHRGACTSGKGGGIAVVIILICNVRIRPMRIIAFQGIRGTRKNFCSSRRQGGKRTVYTAPEIGIDRGCPRFMLRDTVIKTVGNRRGFGRGDRRNIIFFIKGVSGECRSQLFQVVDAVSRFGKTAHFG